MNLSSIHNNSNSFNDFVNKIGVTDNKSKYDLIIIHHLLPTHIVFFQTLFKLFKFVHFIPIPYSINNNTGKDLGTNCKIYKSDNIEELRLSLINIIKFEITKKKKFIVLEVGGYFVDVLSSLQTKDFEQYLRGIIEDTEAGHAKYETICSKLNIPIYSVARSSLKLSEDILTGQALSFSAEKILRKNNEIISGKNILVIGFGKIGRPMSLFLRNKNANVTVYDSNPIRQIEAFSYGFPKEKKDILFSKAEIIFGVTGKTSICALDIPKLNKDVLLISGSSRQNEFDIKGFQNKSHEVQKINENLTSYNYKFYPYRIIIANDGFPINFLDNAIIGNNLHLVWGEIMIIIQKLVEKSSKEILIGKINELSINERQKIASSWINKYCK